MNHPVRRLLLGVALLLGAVSAPAVAVAGTDDGVRVVTGAAVCGGSGFSLLLGPHRSSCVHTAPDAPDPQTQARWRGTNPATAPPRCYGDGSSGPRVQLIYGYLKGQPNRAATMVPWIRNALAPRMQGVVTAASQGHDLGIRFAYDALCSQLSVPVIQFPHSVVEGRTPSDANAQLTKLIGTLQSLGYDREDRKYQLIWDWWDDGGICGLGEVMPDQDTPDPANPNDGLPTVGARTTVTGSPVPLPKYSAVWRTTFGPRGVGCFELGQSHAEGEVHELFHTLGAVQLSAPHSDGGAHCTDSPSVMCPHLPYAVRSCALQKVEVLDCGQDDYWNPVPAQGSYLQTHLNIAKSSYFGPQPQDQLMASPL